MVDKAAAKAGRMTVQVDAETHRALQSYSELTDIPIGKVLARAVREWMNTTGHVHLEVMTGKAGTPLLVSDAEVSRSAAAETTNA